MAASETAGGSLTRPRLNANSRPSAALALGLIANYPVAKCFSMPLEHLGDGAFQQALRSPDPLLWAAASELVSYRSMAGSGFASVPALPSCYDRSTTANNLSYWSHVEDDILTACAFDLGDVDGYWKSSLGKNVLEMESKFGPPGFLG